MQGTTGLLIFNIIRTMPTCHSPDSADKFCVVVLWSAPRYDTQHLTTPVVLQRRWATWSAKTWVWLTTTLVLALLKLCFPEEWHLLYCSCCVTILARCSRTQLGVMRDRRFYRRISRPNNSRKASSEMIRCLSDYSTAVGGYLVNLVSHRPTCSGI